MDQLPAWAVGRNSKLVPTHTATTQHNKTAMNDRFASHYNTLNMTYSSTPKMSKLGINEIWCRTEQRKQSKTKTVRVSRFHWVTAVCGHTAVDSPKTHQPAELSVVPYYGVNLINLANNMRHDSKQFATKFCHYFTKY